MKRNRFQEIDRVIRTHIEKRGLEGISSGSALEQAVDSLAGSERVIIVTGFLVQACMIGETDGPIGALSLSHALERMGRETMILTDSFSLEMLKRGAKILGLKARIEAIPLEETDAYLERQLMKFSPSHIVAIERPGSAEDGRCYSMNGEDLSHWIPSADHLFESGKAMGIETIAVGDGGNELGMGGYRDYIHRSVANGRKIASRTGADHLIVAGVSNWGAHGLAAAMSLQAERMLMYPADTETDLLSAIVASGAVDGVTKRTERSVDGYSEEENLGIYKKLLKIVVGE